MGIESQATRLTARIAPYKDAISKAREAGLTWGDLARLFGTVHPDRLRWAHKHCKYAAEQIPLPERAPPHTGAVNETVSDEAITAHAATKQSTVRRLTP